MQALLKAARDQSHMPTTDDGIGVEVDLAVTAAPDEDEDVGAGNTGSGANGGALRPTTMATTMGAYGTGANNDVRCPTGGGEATGVPYASKSRVLKRSVTGGPRAHPALCTSATPPLAKRMRVGQPCSSRSEAADYIELFSGRTTLKHDKRSDSEDDADRLRNMPPGHADWRPIQLG